MATRPSTKQIVLSLTRQILEHLIICGPSMMVSALLVPYGSGMTRAARDVERLMADCPHDFSTRSQYTISTTLSRLSKRGVVAKKGPNKKAVWRITESGRRHFITQSKSAVKLPPEDGKIRLVIFDIPEGQRDKRRRLRVRLLSNDYSPLQKSVWMGTRPLRKELLDELRTMRLTPYVHVVGLEARMK